MADDAMLGIQWQCVKWYLAREVDPPRRARANAQTERAARRARMSRIIAAEDHKTVWKGHAGVTSNPRKT